MAKIKAPEELQVTISKPTWHILVDEASDSSKANSWKPNVESYFTCVNCCLLRSNKGLQFESCARIMLVRMLGWSRLPRATVGK